MSEFLSIVAIAIVIQSVVEIIKTKFPIISDIKGLIPSITIVLGVMCAIAFGADIFAEFGLNSIIPFFGQIMTGLVCSGGSNIVHDILEKIKAI